MPNPSKSLSETSLDRPIGQNRIESLLDHSIVWLAACLLGLIAWHGITGTWRFYLYGKLERIRGIDVLSTEITEWRSTRGARWKEFKHTVMISYLDHAGAEHTIVVEKLGDLEFYKDVQYLQDDPSIARVWHPYYTFLFVDLVWPCLFGLIVLFCMQALPWPELPWCFALLTILFLSPRSWAMVGPSILIFWLIHYAYVSVFPGLDVSDTLFVSFLLSVPIIGLCLPLFWGIGEITHSWLESFWRGDLANGGRRTKPGSNVSRKKLKNRHRRRS